MYLSPALTLRRPKPPEVGPADPDAQPQLFPEPTQEALPFDEPPREDRPADPDEVTP